VGLKGLEPSPLAGRDRGLHPETEERFWFGFEAVQEVTGLQVLSIFGQSSNATTQASGIKSKQGPVTTEQIRSSRSTC
jgi:hypothetical protein